MKTKQYLFLNTTKQINDKGTIEENYIIQINAIMICLCVCGTSLTTAKNDIIEIETRSKKKLCRFNGRFR